MKFLSTTTLLVLVSIFFLKAQESEEHPLADSYIIQNGGGDEIVTIEGYN